MICTVNIGGCLSFKIETGSFNSNKMIEWCTQSLLPILNEKRRAIVMDNASFHHSDAVVSCIQLDESIVYL